MNAVASHPLLRLPTVRRLSRDRGLVTVWMVASSLAMILLAGLAVDLPGRVHAQQRAQDIAAQAARAGGQAITAQAISGQLAGVDNGRGIAAARTYLAASNTAGTARIGANDSVIVDTSGVYDTTFLSVIGITSLAVTGHAEQQTQRALGGEHQ